MKEQEIVQQSLFELAAALPDAVSVRTAGGDGDSSPPACILSWDSSRISVNGANPFGGILTDTTGDAIGEELHRYHRMKLDVTMRTYDEGLRDRWLSDVADHFLGFEYRAQDFDSDSFEWEVGDAEPRNNPVVEPDWYEGGLTIRFNYVSRIDRLADTLTSVQESVTSGN